jgi:KamA family protein
MHKIPQFSKLPPEKRHELEVLTHIFPFKTNNYVVNELIDWGNYAEDPIFLLNFPWREMLEENEFHMVSQLFQKKVSEDIIIKYVKKIKLRLLPQFAPKVSNLIQSFKPISIPGLYHQFPQIISAFPISANTCYAYCTYCFRWMTFAFDDICFNYSNQTAPVAYLLAHPEISDVLFTGGDALHMNAGELNKFISPLLEIDSVRTIRLGTRTLTWWPYRFVTDQDADELLAFFECIISKGKHLTLMAHISHPRELMTDVVQRAIRKIRSTGTVIRCQCPIIKRLNDSSGVWIELIKREIQLGLIPYYMFIESSKTLNPVFKIPLSAALQIYQDTQRQFSGLLKTLRGPVLTTGSFKILIDGIAELGKKKVFVLKVLQATNPDQNGKIYFAQYDKTITNFEQLRPAFGHKHLF